MEAVLAFEESRGKVVYPDANSTMRVLRAIYNFARATHEHLPENPVSRLSQTRAWYREDRRRGGPVP